MRIDFGVEDVIVAVVLAAVDDDDDVDIVVRRLCYDNEVNVYSIQDICKQCSLVTS